MDAYCATIRKLEDKFYDIEYHHMVWANNQAANELSKIGSTQAKFQPECSSRTLWPLPSSRNKKALKKKHPPSR